MNLDDFISGFAEQFEDTDSSEITAETKFQELDEWSSILVLSVIALVKTQYNKSITGKQIRSCNTVKELFDLVSSL